MYAANRKEFSCKESINGDSRYFVDRQHTGEKRAIVCGDAVQNGWSACDEMEITGTARKCINKQIKQGTQGSLTTRDINAFYDVLYRDGVLSNTVIHYHAVLRRAFQQAFREDIIDVNPFDKIERPRKSKFKGDHYSEEELLALIALSKNDVIFPAIILAVCMGLRRSEAAGVRWSHIDFDNKTVLLDTKIVEVKNGDGTSTVIPVEEMKNKTSRRTLPLPESVYDMLLDQYMKRERYKKMFGDSYNDEYEDYVCFTQLGDLLRPTYITNHFAGILKKHGMRQIRFHDLRHTFASILIKNDTQLIDVSNFLGHSDIATTVNIKNPYEQQKSQNSLIIKNNRFVKNHKSIVLLY